LNLTLARHGRNGIRRLPPILFSDEPFALSLSKGWSGVAKATTSSARTAVEFVCLNEQHCA
jgi:hypothetical protein